MFVGHYGPSYVIKAAQPAIPLWLLFIAVQLVDVAWSMLIMLGIEKARIVPGITASNPFDLYYMPYTHSFVAAILWSVAAGGLCNVLFGLRKWSAAVWIGAAVFSHWILDWVVHRPDLPLYDDTVKVGLGIWNYPMIALILEALLLFGGMFIYMRRTTAVNALGRIGPPGFGILMIAIQTYIFFGPPPASSDELAVTAIASYLVFAVVIWWLDRQRRDVIA